MLVYQRVNLGIFHGMDQPAGWFGDCVNQSNGGNIARFAMKMHMFHQYRLHNVEIQWQAI